MMDETDRCIINRLQGGFPLVESPFLEVAAEFGMAEANLIRRIAALRASGVLSRFGPMYDAKALGGAFTLCAMSVPCERFDEVTELVNARDEVAHNYERDHELNMWFVLATETPEQIPQTIEAIEADTGLQVLDLPKLDEYFLELRLVA
ncbi:MAG: AsnC family transcriptional regulator [Geminicoccaceae bacterium]